MNSGTLALTLANGSGEFTVTNGASLNVGTSGGGSATLSGAASIDGPGNFTVISGTITNNGAFQIQGSNTFNGGAFTLNGSCLVTNGALVINGGGTVALNGTGTLAPASLGFSSGTMLGSMTVTVTGPSTWTGGTIGNAGSSLALVANGGLSVSGFNKNLTGGTLVNGGVGVWTAGTINCSPGSVFSNAPAGTFDLQADGNAIAVAGGGGQLVNAGMLRKTAGSGTSTISVPCGNSGTVLANIGTLSFSGNYIQTGGQTVLNGGAFSFGQTAQIRDGTFSGNGTVTGSVSNNALMRPGGSPGLLAISGNYSQGANGHLQIELAGTTAGTGYDQLSVGGAASLSGTLDVSFLNSFVPGPGNVFTTMVYSVHSGGFSTIQAPTNNLSTIYNAKNFLLEPGNIPPTAGITVGLVQLAGHSFALNGSGSDVDGTVTNLTLFLDTNVLVSASGASASATFSTDFPGALNLSAQATDDKGAQGVTNVTVNITTLPLLTLDPIGFQANRSFKLLMLGEAGTNYQLQASDNLGTTNWPVLGLMENTNGIWRYFDRYRDQLVASNLSRAASALTSPNEAKTKK